MPSLLLAKRLSWPMQIAVWLMSFYVLWNVVEKGYGKTVAAYAGTNFFERYDLPYWVFAMVAVIELVGPFLLFIPQVSFYSAVPLFIIMVTAMVITGTNQLLMTLAILLFIIAFFSRPGLLKKKPVITKIQI